MRGGIARFAPIANRRKEERYGKVRCDLCSQVWSDHRESGSAGKETTARRELQSFGELVGECAARSLFPIASATAAAIGTVGAGAIGCGGGLSGGGSSRCVLALRRLRGVGTQETVFERCAVESADDGLHFVIGGRFDESEALGFLGFVVADHLDGIGDEVFGGEPLFDVIGGDPS